MLMISLVNVGTSALGSDRDDFMSDANISFDSSEPSETLGAALPERDCQAPGLPPLHVCHLGHCMGHCGFVVSLPATLEAPEFCITQYQLRDISYVDADLLSKKKPPKA